MKKNTKSNEVDISKWNNISEVFKETCDKFQNKVALTCMGADITYNEFDILSNNFAAYLQSTLGLKKGDRIAIMLPNILQFPICFYAAQKIGLICVNTNPLYTQREMQHQFKDAEVSAIIILDVFLDKLENIIESTDIKHVICTSIGDQLPALKGALINTVMKLKGLIPAHNLKVISFKVALKIGKKQKLTKVSISQDDIALLQYTGGTTGVSKGAELTQANILSQIVQITNAAHGKYVPGEETVLTALPLYHIFALVANFITFFTFGSRSILVPKPIPIINLIKIFKKYNITIMTGVNTLYNALLNHDEFKSCYPKNMKFAIAGGMALQKNVIKKWSNLLGQQIVEGYGLTECSPVATLNPLDAVIDSTIGKALLGTQIKLVDDQGKEVKDGETGELIIKGPQVMKGYWKKPEETKNTIKDGWLYTGDIATHKDGYYTIVDRKKDMILVSGFNVFPNEIEDILAEHPKVLESAVIGEKDAKSGELVKAFIVKKEQSLTEAELREYCKDLLTGYKRPRKYEFRAELPKSNVGKILRKDLRKNS